MLWLVMLAMLFYLGRIVNYIIQGGGVMICTSNFTPEKLTPSGGGSSIFKPYIEKFSEKLIPYDMDSVIDYRAKAGADKFPYYLHSTPENAGKLQRFIDDFSDFSELKELKANVAIIYIYIKPVQMFVIQHIKI